MRHRLANNGLSRDTSHRMLMLRNLVSSLFQHEQIQTTIPKAKQAQRLADSVIQWAKRGTQQDRNRANMFLLNSGTTLNKLFTEYAQRYQQRPGGYTRIVKTGFRQGDHAPMAVLQLVDGSNDFKFEFTAKSLGREMAIKAKQQQGGGPQSWTRFRQQIESSSNLLETINNATELSSLTRRNIVKALRYTLSPPQSTSSETSSSSSSSSSSAVDTTKIQRFLDRSYHHYLQQLATFNLSSADEPVPDPNRQIKQLTQRLKPSETRGSPKQVVTVPLQNKIPKAGQITEGWKGQQHDDLVQQEYETKLKRGPISRVKFQTLKQKRKQITSNNTTSTTAELNEESRL
ncbi:54S ribosomal protein L8, mitochondrial [Microbotryomycetes sp. JL221]|nr:54S ribosomal protein L8, mitochondrial [Microbotryomycetes sp. JL221]